MSSPTVIVVTAAQWRSIWSKVDPRLLSLSRALESVGVAGQEANEAMEDYSQALFDLMTKGQRRRYVKRMVREEIWRRRHGRRD